MQNVPSLPFLVPPLVLSERLSRRGDGGSSPRSFTIDSQIQGGVGTDGWDFDRTHVRAMTAWAGEGRALFARTTLEFLQISLETRISWHFSTLPEAPVPNVAAAFWNLEGELLGLHRRHAPARLLKAQIACTFEDGGDRVRCEWRDEADVYGSFDLDAGAVGALSRRFRAALHPWAKCVAKIEMRLAAPAPSGHERAALARR